MYSCCSRELDLLLEESPSVDETEPKENRIALFSRKDSRAVGVGLGFSRISNVDVISGTFEARFILRLWYVEPQLRDHPTIVGWQDWREDCPGHPEVSTCVFANAKEVVEMQVSKVVVNDHVNNGLGDGIEVPGLVRLNYWVSGTFCQEFSLKRFPYDSHFLSIHVRNVFAGKTLELVPIKEHVDFKHQPWLIDFMIYGPPAASLSYQEEHDDRKHRVIFSVAIQRKAFAHELNIFGILFMLNAISFTSFIMGSLADQMSVSLTLLLTAVAFKFVIADKLPAVSYLTTMDVYILSVFCFLGLVILANVLSTLFPRRQRAFVAGVLGLWTAFHVIFALRVRYLRRPLARAYFDEQVHSLVRVHWDAERAHRFKLE